MITIFIALAVAGYFVCGVLAYGVTFAFFQREYPLIAKKERGTDRQRAAFAACAGPAGLFSALLTVGTKHGLLFR